MVAISKHNFIVSENKDTRIPKLVHFTTVYQVSDLSLYSLRYNSTLSLTSALDGVGGQQHAPAALPPRKRPGTHFKVGWVGPRAGLDGRKISLPPGFDPRTVQPVASRYTD